MSTPVATTIESNSPRAEMDALIEQCLLADLINNDPTI